MKMYRAWRGSGDGTVMVGNVTMSLGVVQWDTHDRQCIV
jgi:hypothetical protein